MLKAVALSFLTSDQMNGLKKISPGKPGEIIYGWVSKYGKLISRHNISKKIV